MATFVHVYRPCGILIYLRGLQEDSECCVIPYQHSLQLAIADSIVQQRRRMLPQELMFLRIHLNLSRKAFASLFGITKAEVVEWELGSRTPRISHEAGLRRYIFTSRFRKAPDASELLSWNAQVKNPEDLYYIFDASSPPSYRLIRTPTV